MKSRTPCVSYGLFLSSRLSVYKHFISLVLFPQRARAAVLSQRVSRQGPATHPQSFADPPRPRFSSKGGPTWAPSRGGRAPHPLYASESSDDDELSPAEEVWASLFLSVFAFQLLFMCPPPVTMCHQRTMVASPANALPELCMEPSELSLCCFREGAYVGSYQGPGRGYRNSHTSYIVHAHAMFLGQRTT